MFGIKTKRNVQAQIRLAPPKALSRLIFDLEQRLLSFSPTDHWTLRDACQGTQIMGGTGKGRRLVVPPEWLRRNRVMRQAGRTPALAEIRPRNGREKSLIVFGGDGSRHFNFLDYELRRGDRLVTHNLVSLFMRIKCCETYQRVKSETVSLTTFR